MTKRAIWSLMLLAVLNVAWGARTNDVPAEWKSCADVISAINNEDYTTAYANANFLASAGDNKASYLLAAMSMCGVGGEKNYEAAITTLSALAKDGDRRAQYMLGGFGSLQKQQEFMKLLLGEDYDPKELGVDDNSFWYQMMSYEGKSEKFSDTLEWMFAPLDEVAYRDIMYYAGVFCLTGQFGFQDFPNGLMWLQQSSQKGYDEATQLLQQLLGAAEEVDDDVIVVEE